MTHIPTCTMHLKAGSKCRTEQAKTKRFYSQGQRIDLFLGELHIIIIAYWI